MREAYLALADRYRAQLAQALTLLGDADLRLPRSTAPAAATERASPAGWRSGSRAPSPKRSRPITR